ncbi:hypothetical protein DPEC_G00305480 [Dallia pectoralis]|uniref:Uncharacterized protein n=1 Tax=Dallia pectoralis TaxID=75939 RepID=A0ACC2FDQ3_DALPE|nr:hypothetical protein DPEC_G00305480 [Dallia pectoralis]
MLSEAEAWILHHEAYHSRMKRDMASSGKKSYSHITVVVTLKYYRKWIPVIARNLENAVAVDHASVQTVDAPQKVVVPAAHLAVASITTFLTKDPQISLSLTPVFSMLMVGDNGRMH